MRLNLSFALILAAAGLAAAEPPLTIERLLAEGWEIAGYASGYDNRTSPHPVPSPGPECARPVRRSLRCDPQPAHDRQLLRVAVRHLQGAVVDRAGALHRESRRTPYRPGAVAQGCSSTAPARSASAPTSPALKTAS